jgi:hypothetical protein
MVRGVFLRGNRRRRRRRAVEIEYCDRFGQMFWANALDLEIFQARSRIIVFNLLILSFFYPKKTSLSIGPKCLEACYKCGFAARQLDRHKRKTF